MSTTTLITISNSSIKTVRTTPTANFNLNSFVEHIKCNDIVIIRIENQNSDPDLCWSNLTTTLVYAFGNIMLHSNNPTAELLTVYNKAVEFISANYNNLCMTSAMKKYWSLNQSTEYFIEKTNNPRFSFLAKPQLTIDFPPEHKNDVSYFIEDVFTIFDTCSEISEDYIENSYKCPIPEFTSYDLCALTILSEYFDALNDIPPYIAAINTKTNIHDFETTSLEIFEKDVIRHTESLK